MDVRPSAEGFRWRGELHYLLPVAAPSAPDRMLGYELTCPLCQRKSFLNTGMGRHPEHTLTHDATGRLMLDPAVRCPFPGCTFHVIIQHGVALPERRRRPSGPVYGR